MSRIKRIKPDEVPANELDKMLQNEGISSDKILREYVNRHYGQSSDIPFRILRANDVGLKELLSKNELDCQNTIFDVPTLIFDDKAKLFFRNCIFMGKVTIQHQSTCPTFEHVILVSCLIHAKLIFSEVLTHNDQPEGGITLNGVNCPSVIFDRCTNLALLHIVRSRIGYLSLTNIHAQKLNTLGNMFDHLDVAWSSFESVNFPAEQVPLRKQCPVYDEEKINQTLRSFDLFFFIPDILPEQIDRHAKHLIRNNTFKFLKEQSDSRLNTNSYSQVRYLETLSAQPNKFFRRIQQATGALLKPSRFALWMLGVWLAFGLLYLVPCWNKFEISTTNTSITAPLTIGQSFYFSGITFTTIGYGDISPLGLSRSFAVIEGLLGIVLVSAFLVSLTRKYLTDA